MGTGLLIIILIVILLACFCCSSCYWLTKISEREAKEREIQERETSELIDKYNEEKNALFAKYGEPAVDITRVLPTADEYVNQYEKIIEEEYKGPYGVDYSELSPNIISGHSYPYNYRNHLYVFEKQPIIIVNGKEFDFSMILGFELVDNSTEETIGETTGQSSASTGSMFGRAIVGGMVGGEVGAMIGGSTAGRDYTYNTQSTSITHHWFVLYIHINSMSSPLVTFRIGDDIETAQKAVAVMNIILERKKLRNTK